MRNLAGGLVALLLGLGLQGSAAGPPAGHVDTAAPVERGVEHVIAPVILPGLVVERLQRAEPVEPRDDVVRPGRRLHVDGEVLQILTAPVMDGGAAQLPTGLNEVGHLANTVSPGTAGTTTLAVHSSRHAPAERLDGVDPGEQLAVDWGATRHRYKVVRRVEGIDPDWLPMRLVAEAGPHRLAIVTCGDFNGTEWRTRTIVWGVPMK